MTAVLALALGACIPSHLQKYRKDGDAKPIASTPTAPSALDGAQDPMMNPGPRTRGQAAAAPAPQPAAAAQAAAAAQRASIYAIDKQTYRFQLKDAEVWDSALNVLLRNYNLTIVDRTSGIISTEWDSYFLGSAVYRNKLSMRISSSGRGAVDVTIHNNVERLRDAAQATGSVGAVWLPTEDQANEVARIIQNMALVLNQPPPVLPPNGAIAKGVSPQDSGVNR